MLLPEPSLDPMRRENTELPVVGSRNLKETGPVRPLRILVAEDSTDSCLLVQAYLKGTPHQLTFAEDGNAAGDRFAAGSFDLILIDMQMPVMDGLTPARAKPASASPRSRSTPRSASARPPSATCPELEFRSAVCKRNSGNCVPRIKKG
jgi:PleD family two-component response regulator